jgi:hypothetical protein
VAEVQPSRSDRKSTRSRCDHRRALSSVPSGWFLRRAALLRLRVFTPLLGDHWPAETALPIASVQNSRITQIDTGVMISIG